MNQRDTTSAVESSNIAARRESIGIGCPQATSIKTPMPSIRQTSGRMEVIRLRILSFCRLVECVAAMGVVAFALYAVLFDRSNLVSALVFCALATIFMDHANTSTVCPHHGTCDKTDCISMDADHGKPDAANQAGRAS